MDFDYYQLRAYFLKREEKRTVRFKLIELSELWLCTIKQCKRRLQKYQLEQKLIYKPGMGRGHYSELFFCKDFRQEIRKISKKAIQEDALDEVIQLLQLDIPKEWFDQVLQEIQGMFGVQRSLGNQDTIRYILRRPITSLDPLQTSISKEAFMIRQLGDTLLIYNEEQHQLMPGLAHHWRVSEDYRCWTFFLRKGVRFHHGRTLVSKDVKHTLMRAMAEESVVAWQLKNIEEISCPHEFKVVVKLKVGEPFFGQYVSTGNLTILPFDVLFNEKKWVSTGPFKIKDYSESNIILEAFEDYYGERPLMDRVEFWVVENQTVQMTVSTYPEAVEEEYTEQAYHDVGVEFLIFNFHRSSYIEQSKFREAIYHLLDLTEIKKTLDIGKPASSYYVEKSCLIKKDSMKVKSLLKEANYQGETLVLGTFNCSDAKKKARWLQKKASEHGVSIEIREMSIDTAFYTKEFEEQTDMLLLRDIPVIDKELAFLDFCSNPKLMCQRFLSEELISRLDKKLEKMKSCENYEQRVEEYEQIDRWLSENHYLIYLSHPLVKGLVHAAIEVQEKKLFINLNLRTAWAEGKEEG